MKIREIAEAINGYLKKFEADPKINKPREGKMRLAPYYHAYAVASGRYVRVCYVSFQRVSTLTKAEAEEYLKWLEAGNVGTHYKALSFNTRIAEVTSGSEKPDVH